MRARMTWLIGVYQNSGPESATAEYQELLPVRMTLGILRSGLSGATGSSTVTSSPNEYAPDTTMDFVPELNVRIESGDLESSSGQK